MTQKRQVCADSGASVRWQTSEGEAGSREQASLSAGKTLEGGGRKAQAVEKLRRGPVSRDTGRWREANPKEGEAQEGRGLLLWCNSHVGGTDARGDQHPGVG
mgnify:CR=1 FL=1